MTDQHASMWSHPLGGELLYTDGELTDTGRALLPPELVERLRTIFAGTDYQLFRDVTPLSIDPAGITIEFDTTVHEDYNPWCPDDCDCGDQ